VDRLDVRHRVDPAFDVRDVRIVEDPDDLADGVGLTDVGEELVPQPRAFGRPLDDARDVDERDGGRDRLRRVEDLGQLVQPPVGQGHHSDVGLDCRELNRPDGTPVRETLVAATGSLVPEGAAIVSGEIGGEPMRVGLWRWPHDPALPALSHVVDRDRLRTVLAHAGITPTGPITVHVRSYRPARRAVLAITTGPHHLFAKVVPPASLPGLRIRHELVSARLPAPTLLATTDDGLALMPALPGSSARTALRRGHRLPDAEALENLLDRLPADLTTLPGQPDYRRRARHYAAVLALTALPEGSDRSRVAALADAITEAEPGDHPVV